MWSVSKEEAWSVTSGGAIYHFANGAWADALASTTAKYSFNAIAGKSESDLWAVGGLNGSVTRTIFHYDGKEWRRREDTPNAQALNAIFVDPASGTGFAVGNEGTVLRYVR